MLVRGMFGVEGRTKGRKGKGGIGGLINISWWSMNMGRVDLMVNVSWEGFLRWMVWYWKEDIDLGVDFFFFFFYLNQTHC